VKRPDLRQLDQEIEEHLAQATEENMSRGMSPAVARAVARRQFGNVTLTKEAVRAIWVPLWIEQLAQDVRLGGRLLIRHWLFTLVTITSLGLSIGFNTTLFTIVDGMSGGSAALSDADTIVTVSSIDQGGRPLGVSYADFKDWARLSRTFEGVGAYAAAAMTLTDRDRAAERVAGAYISWPVFSLLRERPIVGRDFRAEDDRAGAERVAILGASVWRQRYGADSDIVGRTIIVNGTPVTVIGVMRDGFRFPLVHDLWQPLAQLEGIETQPRNARTLRVVGRLAPEIPLDQAAAELTGLMSGLSKAFPSTNADIRPHVEPFLGRFTFANPWNAMLLAVGIVMLIACANIAALLVARASFRSGEVAIRVSLGATRLRIVRQLLTESALLAVIGAGLGLGLTVIGVRLWLASMPNADWPYWYQFAVSPRVFAYLLTVSLGSLLLFGLGPAWLVSNAYPAGHLTNASRRAKAGHRSRRISGVLLTVQVALTLSLLAGAGLLARTLLVVYRADSMVDTSPVTIAGIDLTGARYRAGSERIRFFDELEQRTGAMSAVAAATVASGPPFYDAPLRAVTIQARETRNLPMTSYVVIGTRYFDALGLRIVGGRAFTDSDGTAGHETVIVNQLFASRYLSGVTPLGLRIRLSDPNTPDAPSPWLTIVGVSPTIREHYAQEFDPVVYVPYRLNPPANMTLMVRTHKRAAGLASRLRQEFGQLDPDLPLLDIRPLDWLVSGTRFANQVFAALFALAAGLALLLATIGLYAIISQETGQRTQEIGVRMALGAPRSRLMWLLVRHVVGPVGAGLALGLGGSLAVGRFIRGMLIQTSANDPVTLIVIVVLLTAVALGAALWPAYRATRLSPMVALRFE
jgi:predicted permease